MYYEYKCPECDTEKEVSHGMTEDPEILCPECEAIMKRKIFGGSGTHFKGGGWAGKQQQDSSQAVRRTYKRKATAIGEG